MCLYNLLLCRSTWFFIFRRCFGLTETTWPRLPTSVTCVGWMSCCHTHVSHMPACPICSLLRKWPRMRLGRGRKPKTPNFGVTIYITCEDATRERCTRIKPSKDRNYGHQGHNFNTSLNIRKEKKKPIAPHSNKIRHKTINKKKNPQRTYEKSHTV